MQINKKNAFSVSETLTTLVIVILLGSLLIFTMIHNAQRREAVSQLKKTYLSLTNAYGLLKANEGTPETWVSRGDDYEQVYFKLFSKHLNMQLKDMPPHLSGLVYYGINGTVERYTTKKDVTMGQLNDGIIIRFTDIDPACRSYHGSTAAYRSVCAKIYVQVKDINGNVNLTNAILGKNTFVFYVTQEGIYPVGAKGSKEDAQFMCNKTSDIKIDSESCTAWVMTKENLDYLRRHIEW